MPHYKVLLTEVGNKLIKVSHKVSEWSIKVCNQVSEQSITVCNEVITHCC